MYGICKFSLILREKCVISDLYKNLTNVSKKLENVKSSQFYSLKDVISLYLEEPSDSIKELLNSEILSLYQQIYPQILQQSNNNNLINNKINNKINNNKLNKLSNVKLSSEKEDLRRKLLDMQNSLFSGSLHTLNYDKILLQVRYGACIKSHNSLLLIPPGVVQGVGGDESAKFATELYNMYTNICHNNNLKHIKHPNKTLEIFHGMELFKYEWGVHRVQRIPFNSSRVQTSSAVVTIVPHFNVENNIKSSDLMIETMRSSGSGGQSVNKSETAVRITHLPTGIHAESRHTSSQIDNKVLGLEMLKKKIKEKQEMEIESMKKELRLSQYRTGDRSEKIRTINYIHDTVTDHRCKVTLHNVNSYLNSGQGLELIRQTLEEMDKAKIIQFFLQHLTTLIGIQ